MSTVNLKLLLEAAEQQLPDPKTYPAGTVFITVESRVEDLKLKCPVVGPAEIDFSIIPMITVEFRRVFNIVYGTHHIEWELVLP